MMRDACPSEDMSLPSRWKKAHTGWHGAGIQEAAPACAWSAPLALLPVPGPVQGASILRRWLGLGANQGAPHPRTLTSPQALRNSRDTRADLSGIPRCPGELLPFRVGSDSPEHPCPRSRTAGLSLLAVPVPIARSTRCDMVVRPSQRLEPPIGLVSRPLRPHGPEYNLRLKVVAGQTFP